MKRLLAMTLVFILATLVGAQGDSSRVTPAQQAAMLERNRELLKATIDTGLELTSDNGPLDRAAMCTKLAGKWSDAIRSAASSKETSRVHELGKHFETVIDRGVVSNLRDARSKIKSGSKQESELDQRRDEAIKVLDKLESDLAGPQEFEPVRKQIHAGRDKLEKATKLDKR